ncbi:hypothetical protein BDV96DRAFT_649752 [Lophiotrema nucula]|uniref:Uncharacterized protein n=1 Tax=Lophiotrema nucula TaxID=690887 RepID=A0A6A5YY80_9PLEO|nr:hypothetical protein BDV96DRAFT_649752 [Lophiotrema nucula]
MSHSIGTPPLLAIPLELREMLYKEVLLDGAAGPQLLRTCREIYTEAEKYLYQRPLFFHSQSILANWLDTTPKKYHDHVIDITIHLQDVDLNPLLNSTSNTQPTSSRLRSWDLYELDLKNLHKSLVRLRNVNKVTIRAVSGRQSFLYRDFLGRFLETLGDIYPAMVGLALEGNFHHQNLRFLASLLQLESFSFDGFSATSPSDTASILSDLERLTSLSIVSHHAMLTPTNHLHSTFTEKTQSFTDTVVRNMNRLASFHLVERTFPEQSPSLFFTSDVLASLHSHSSLTKLTLNLSYTPVEEMLEALDNFLGHSSIESLELDWPNLDPGALSEHDLLPNTTKHFWIRAMSLDAAHDIVLNVLESRTNGELPDLRRVVFVREPWDLMEHDAGTHQSHSSNETKETSLPYATRNLAALGVMVSWYTEESRS